MSATCPAGHRSATADYCDQCGAPHRCPARGRHETRGARRHEHDAGHERVARERRHARGAERRGPGHDRFCEICGFDLARHDPRSAVLADSGWAAEVAPDLAYFERVAPEGLTFPVRRGGADRSRSTPRASGSAGGARPGDDAPEIELGDPAVSRLHATLVHAQDGSWAIVDEGSSNGTTLNADADPIPSHLEVPLRDGDEVHVGAWTTITLALRSRAA